MPNSYISYFLGNIYCHNASRISKISLGKRYCQSPSNYICNMHWIISLEANLTSANMVGTNNKIYMLHRRAPSISTIWMVIIYAHSSFFSLSSAVHTDIFSGFVHVASKELDKHSRFDYNMVGNQNLAHVGSIICRRNSSEQSIYILAKPSRVRI